MRTVRENAETRAEDSRRHVMKSEQSPNRLEQNQNALKLELKPVKRYEHLTGGGFVLVVRLYNPNTPWRA